MEERAVFCPERGYVALKGPLRNDGALAKDGPVLAQEISVLNCEGPELA